VKLSSLLEDLVAPLRGSDVALTVNCEARAEGSAEPVLTRNPGLSYGLSNILENAIDFAESSVTVEAGWTDTYVTLRVVDDGPGFDSFIFDRLGDPFVTTRPGYDVAVDASEAGGHEGMGLGLFIAKTLLERSGATVSMSNRASPQHGADVKLQWPRGSLDVGQFPSKALDPKPAQRH
jgi:two-component system, sensor histidine kinase RegB